MSPVMYVIAVTLQPGPCCTKLVLGKKKIELKISFFNILFSLVEHKN